MIAGRSTKCNQLALETSPSHLPRIIVGNIDHRLGLAPARPSPCCKYLTSGSYSLHSKEHTHPMIAGRSKKCNQLALETSPSHLPHIIVGNIGHRLGLAPARPSPCCKYLTSGSYSLHSKEHTHPMIAGRSTKCNQLALETSPSHLPHIIVGNIGHRLARTRNFSVPFAPHHCR